MQDTVKQQGFTLMEMMVVMAIIAILAAMALPMFSYKVTQQQIEESLEKVAPYKALVDDNHQLRVSLGAKEGELFALNNEELTQMPPANKIIGNYIDHVQLKDGVITMTFSQSAHKALQDKQLSLIPSYVADHYQQSLDWRCGYKQIPAGKKSAGDNQTNIEKKYLPFSCR